MKKIEKGTICMVVNDCIINDLNNPVNIKGRLLYNRGVFSFQCYVMSDDEEAFIAAGCKQKDLIPINPFKLNKSLASAYRRTQPFGRLNPFLEVPIGELRKEYVKYVKHFVEYLAKED